VGVDEVTALLLVTVASEVLEGLAVVDRLIMVFDEDETGLATGADVAEEVPTGAEVERVRDGFWPGRVSSWS